MRKISYQLYENGYDRKELSLGTLAFDFVYPETKEPYRHSELSAGELDQFTVSDHRPTCYLASRGNSTVSFGLGLQDLVGFHNSNSKGSYTIIVGKDGSQVKLLRPEKFFREHVLENDEARLWLISRLTVMHRLQLLGNYVHLKPKVWLLIGIYYMRDAVTCHAFSAGSSRGIKGSVPIEPSGLGALLGLNVGARVRLSNEMIVEGGGQVSGEKVWAALWQRVDVKYLRNTASTDDLAVNELRLIDDYSSEHLGVRGGEEEDTFVEVSLTDAAEESDEEDPDGDIPEQFWTDLDREVRVVEKVYF